MFIMVNDPLSNRNLVKYPLTISGMKCCMTCQLFIYSNPQCPTPILLLHWHYPPTKGGHKYTFSSVGKYVPWGCLPPTFTFTTNIQFWHNIFPSSKYVHFRGSPLYLPTPSDLKKHC